MAVISFASRRAVLWTFIYVFVSVSASTRHSDVANLTQSLLSNYNKMLRPIKNYDEPLNVSIALILSSINWFDDVSGKIATTGFLKLSWTDEFLKWNLKDNNIDILFLPTKLIWTPDVQLLNGITGYNAMGYEESSMVRVNFEGQITWLPGEVMKTKCILDVTKYPFDHQTCDMKFVIWNMGIKQVELKPLDEAYNTFEVENVESNNQWTIISKDVKQERSNSSVVVFSMTLVRNYLRSLLNIFVPLILLAFLDACTFLVPLTCGERLQYSISVFLSLTVVLTIIDTRLPESSGSTSFLAIYVFVLLVQGCLIIFFSLVQSRMVYPEANKKAPKWLNDVMCYCYCTFSSYGVNRKRKNYKDLNKDADKNEEELTWGKVCSSTDLVLFFCFFFNFVLCTMLLFMYTAVVS